jgi:hypothetical protein
MSVIVLKQTLDILSEDIRNHLLNVAIEIKETHIKLEH